MEKYAYFNGNIMLEEDIRISHRDLGFIRGYGVMDAMRTFDGKPFSTEEHFRRLKNGIKGLNLQVDFTLEKFKKSIQELIIRNNIKEDVAIKTIVSGGESSNGLVIDGSPTILITLNNLEAVLPSKEAYKKGVGVVSVEFARDTPSIKTTNYICALQHQQQKEQAGAAEIIYKNKGVLLEGSTSNIFIVKNGVIIVPAEGILKGVTRDFVLDILRSNDMDVEERNVLFEELVTADEAWLTGSFKGILPIVNVDNLVIGGGIVGDITKKTMELFNVKLKSLLKKDRL